MSPFPSQQQPTPDDERDDQFSQNDAVSEPDEAEEEEEEDEEPQLKYQRMSGSLSSLLSSDSASCISVADRMIALGTHSGSVHILDFLGNQIKHFRVHKAAVNGLSFDADGEFVGSCSDDGTVVISSLFTDEKEKFDYHRPMKAIVLDPDYARQGKRYVAGGLAGELLLFYTKRTLFGYQKKEVLHSGEGPIHAVTWRKSFIAWANDAGVKVYDLDNQRCVQFVERPRGSPHPELLRPHLVWQDDTVLIIGWGKSIKITSLRTSPGGMNGSMRTNSWSGPHVKSCQVDYYVSGIAPFGDLLFVLAYIPGQEDAEKEFSSNVPSRQGNAQRPEVRVVKWDIDKGDTEELATDALPVLGFEHYKAKDYSLSYTPYSESSYVNGRWTPGDEPLYYVVSPKDILIAKPRDIEDHINWLLERGLYKNALEELEVTNWRKELYEEVGSRYLEHLFTEKSYVEAASLCPKLLRKSASAWERWIFRFAQLRQLPVLAPYIPTKDPRLSDSLYELALIALAVNPAYHKDFLLAVEAWPGDIYSIPAVLLEIEPQLRASLMTDALKKALAKLYVTVNQHEKAFSLYADLLDPNVFDFIENHKLHDAVHEKVVQLMMLDSKRATSLLIQQRDLITPADVVSQLIKAGDKCNFRYFLYLYLHSLFEVNPDAGQDFHDMQVELYADFDTKMLPIFLRSSQHYSLEKAYEICKSKGLLKEKAYILGRMGNSKQALAVLINELGDIKEALEFASMQNDDVVWEELIKQSIQRPEMVGMLLEHTVGNLDPLHIVNIVPDGLEIPRLRDRLVKIVTDYRTETSLRHGCNDILKADIVNLLVKYYKEARHAIYLSNEEDETRSKRDDNRMAEPIARAPSLRNMDMKSKTKAGGRCCMCFDSLTIQNVTIIAFFCCHAYHMTCYMDSSNTLSDEKEDEDEYGEYDEGEEEEGRSGSPPMRCILCTNATR